MTMTATNYDDATFAREAQPVPAVPAAPPKRRRRALMLSVPVLILAAVGAVWLTGGRYQTTENANLKQARIAIASDVAGRVVEVDVADSQRVKAGDVLFRVDDQPYRLAVAQAEAALASARLQVEQMKVAYREAETRAKLAAETLAYQSGELARQRTLSDKGVAAVSAMDDARHLERLAEEENIAARQGVDKALAALGGEPDAPVDSHPAVRSAMVALEEAKYNLGLTTVTAPADGIVYQAASFRPGQYVTSGTALFALVETGQVWVDANFKETQLTNIREGQEAEIVFDPLPGRTFRARVEAIGAGTGAEFSLLPAQNATGNWVKVTQRLPVRLALEDMPDLPMLASGVSAEVRVDTGKGNSVWDLLTARAGTR
jgi:membrane fusion protein (multidrug efflux system)